MISVLKQKDMCNNYKYSDIGLLLNFGGEPELKHRVFLQNYLEL